MKKLNFLVALATLILLTSMKSDNPAYRLYNTLGKEVKYKKLVKAAAQADIVLFGESHNNPISHWLQLQLTKDLYAVRGASLVLAAEMFESDNQLLLDEYISGSIRQKNFEDEAKLWKNYTTDYKPLVEFAKDSNLYFIASNIPRRYASIVHKGGFEALNDLSTQAKALIAPLPITYDPELECYKGMLEMMGGMAHANENLPKAQAAKDATMAYFIYNAFEPGKLIIHFNGSYHSDNYQSIVWYLKKLNPDLKILTITTVEQDSIEAVEDENLETADYIICVPADMTKTY